MPELPSSVPAREAGPPRTAAVLRKDFPCKGCELRLPPAADSLAKAPLLVVLHGDLGDAWKMTRVWSAAAEGRGMILASLRCPQDKGCGTSWWRWYLGRKHDDGWLAAQIIGIQADYPVDPRRVYAAGYSGGASYLGYYAPVHPELFAAVSHVAGGVRFAPACSRCKTPVHFLIGGQDPMIPLYTDTLRRWYEDCGGHPLVWNVLPGVTHDSIVDLLQASRAREVVDWLMQYEQACR